MRLLPVAIWVTMTSWILRVESHVKLQNFTMSAFSLPVDQFKVRIPSHMRDHNDEEERAPIDLKLSDNSLTRQLASIFRKGHTTNEVFVWLNLHKEKGSILANPYMNRWMRYMKRFNNKPDSQKTTPLRTVQHYYVNGDDTVFPEVIAVGKQDFKTKQKAELLEWLHQKRHPKLVFEQLMVNHENTNVLATIRSSHWIDYLEWYNIEHPESQTTLFNTLGQFYQGIRWDGMIRAGRKDRGTERLAAQLQMLHERKDLEEFRKEMERRNVVANFLGHNNWLTWYKYLIYFNKIYPEREQSLRDTLEAYCKDGKLVDELSRKIKGLKNVPPITDAELKELKPEVDPEIVFKEKKLDEALDLDKARYQIFKTNQLRRLMKYVNLYKKEFPDFKNSLRGIFPDKDQVLVDLLFNQVPHPRVKGAMKQVLNDLSEDWLRKKMSPTDVFKILVKEIVDTSSFSSSRFHEWLRYFLAFDSKFKAKKVSIMSTLNSKSGEKLLEFLGSLLWYNGTHQQLFAAIRVSAKNDPADGTLAKCIARIRDLRLESNSSVTSTNSQLPPTTRKSSVRSQRLRKNSKSSVKSTDSQPPSTMTTSSEKLADHQLPLKKRKSLVQSTDSQPPQKQRNTLS